MRTGFLFPLVAVVIAGAAGCSRQASEESAALPQRDLTRVDPAPKIEFASAVELQKPLVSPQSVQPRATTRALRAARRSTVDFKPLAAVMVTPTPAVAAQPEPTPAPPAEPLSDRELLPGKTVTLIPASSGPSTAVDPGEDVGLTMIRQGHRCPPARPGIGITARPRPTAY
jgi:hypothetical protein